MRSHRYYLLKRFRFSICRLPFRFSLRWFHSVRQFFFSAACFAFHRSLMQFSACKRVQRHRDAGTRLIWDIPINYRCYSLIHQFSIHVRIEQRVVRRRTIANAVIYGEKANELTSMKSKEPSTSNMSSCVCINTCAARCDVVFVLFVRIYQMDEFYEVM